MTQTAPGHSVIRGVQGGQSSEEGDAASTVALCGRHCFVNVYVVLHSFTMYFSLLLVHSRLPITCWSVYYPHFTNVKKKNSSRLRDSPQITQRVITRGQTQPWVRVPGIALCQAW